MSNKRCFLNGVFQNGVLRGWPGSAMAEDTERPENTGVFKHSLSLGKSLPLLQAEVRNLKNTVWKTPFVHPEVKQVAKSGHKTCQSSKINAEVLDVRLWELLDSISLPFS